MLLESFAMMLRGILRVPPGASVRKATGPSTSSFYQNSIEDNDYVSTIVSITVDDICVGDTPLSINFKDTTPEVTQLKLKDINAEFNTVVKDVARDLCIHGVSVYDVSVSKRNKLIVMPYIEPLEFYLTKDKEVVCYAPDSNKSLTGKLIFINYNKSSLASVEDKKLSSSLVYKVTPTPMQLANSESAIEGLLNAEDSLKRYRMQIARLVRFVNVDIGKAQGDIQKDVVDTISSAINANSVSLAQGAPFSEFDDNIPILPNRSGLGRAELVSDVPSADIKSLADVDYWLKKLTLIMRFPATYMDFSQNLGSSAVSLIRSDIRYNKLCKAVQSKIVSTLNNYIQSSKFNQYEPVFYLTQLPSSEDDDVVSALDNYVDLTSKVEEYVQGSDDDLKLKLHRLELLQDLFSVSTTSPALQMWFEDFREFLSKSEDTAEEQESSLGTMEKPDFRGSDFSSGSLGGGIESSTSDVEFNPSTEVEETDLSEPAGEFIEPQT